MTRGLISVPIRGLERFDEVWTQAGKKYVKTTRNRLMRREVRRLERLSVA